MCFGSASSAIGRNGGLQPRAPRRLEAKGCPKTISKPCVQAPELELTSADSAKGIWALEDYVRFFPGLNMHGYGHYHEPYEERGGHWRIKSSKLTRLREDIVTPFFSLYLSPTLRSRLVALAR